MEIKLQRETSDVCYDTKTRGETKVQSVCGSSMATSVHEKCRQKGYNSTIQDTGTSDGCGFWHRHIHRCSQKDFDGVGGESSAVSLACKMGMEFDHDEYTSSRDMGSACCHGSVCGDKTPVDDFVNDCLKFRNEKASCNLPFDKGNVLTKNKLQIPCDNNMKIHCEQPGNMDTSACKLWVTQTKPVWTTDVMRSHCKNKSYIGTPQCLSFCKTDGPCQNWLQDNMCKDGEFAKNNLNVCGCFLEESVYSKLKLAMKDIGATNVDTRRKCVSQECRTAAIIPIHEKGDTCPDTCIASMELENNGTLNVGESINFTTNVQCGGTNGTGTNGTGANGTGANGTGANGTGTNGTGTNGTGTNGTGTNDTGTNGTVTNGTAWYIKYKIILTCVIALCIFASILVMVYYMV